MEDAWAEFEREKEGRANMAIAQMQQSETYMQNMLKLQVNERGERANELNELMRIAGCHTRTRCECAAECERSAKSTQNAADSQANAAERDGQKTGRTGSDSSHARCRLCSRSAGAPDWAHAGCRGRSSQDLLGWTTPHYSWKGKRNSSGRKNDSKGGSYSLSTVNFCG